MYVRGIAQHKKDIRKEIKSSKLINTGILPYLYDYKRKWENDYATKHLYKNSVFIKRRNGLYSCSAKFTITRDRKDTELYQERAFYQKVAFTKEIDAEISIYFQDGKYRTNGYLHEKHYVDEDISNIPCIKSSSDFMGMWKFLYDGIEYVLLILSEEDL